MRTAFALAHLLLACGVNQTPQPELLPVLPACVPDRDGKITADELPVALGASVAYYAGTNRTIAQAARAGVWDFSEERPDDDIVAVGPVALRTQWYAAEFPAGQFVVDAGAGLDAIYHQDAQALWLAGTASRAETPRTLVVYTPPIAVLRFPITEGDVYTTTALLDGATLGGLPFHGSDELSVTVDASGRLDVPYVEFSPVLRVRTQLVRRANAGGVPPTSRRTTLWLFECFGEVTRAESQPDEPDPDFTSAATLRRFALGVTP
jgi:hypothetical protein